MRREHLILIRRIDKLIRMKATGNYLEFANRLDISPAKLYRLLDLLKEDLEAPIIYSGICAGTIILLFENTLISIIIIYFYVQIETIFTHTYFIERLGFDLFGYFPGQIIFKLLNSAGWDTMSSLCLVLIYSVFFYSLARKKMSLIS